MPQEYHKFNTRPSYYKKRKQCENCKNMNLHYNRTSINLIVVSTSNNGIVYFDTPASKDKVHLMNFAGPLAISVRHQREKAVIMPLPS